MAKQNLRVLPGEWRDGRQAITQRRGLTVRSPEFTVTMRRTDIELKWLRRWGGAA